MKCHKYGSGHLSWCGECDGCREREGKLQAVLAETVELDKLATCKRCGGRGSISGPALGERRCCPQCKGSGKVE